MAVFKSLADKLQKKKDELQQKAAERAAKMALERGKQAALDAAASARKKIEEALFGDAASPSSAEPAERPEPPAKPREDAAKVAAAKARAAAKLEKDVDDDLAALKKRIAKDR